MNQICIDGRIVPATEPVLTVDNRGYRYGDGLFETMKMVNGKIPLWPYHYQRMSNGINLLGFEFPPALGSEALFDQVYELCKKNQCENLGRVRLSLSRGNGGLYDKGARPHYIIESWPVQNKSNALHEDGLIIDIYPDAHKACDGFANLKSSSFLPYVMAAEYAKNNHYNDCLVLNQHGRIADATIANIFLVKKNEIITPPLSEGCVSGVMRRWLIEKLQSFDNYELKEAPLDTGTLLTADELFLSNAVSGIRWVKQFRNKLYTRSLTTKIYDQFIKTIWQ